MSSEQPTGEFPQPIGQPPYWPASVPRPEAQEVNPILAKYDVPDVVPSVNPGPDWGSIANGLPVDVPKPYAYTDWALLSHDQSGEADIEVKGTYIEGMGTLVRTVGTLRGAVTATTSFLPGVKIADGKLVPFNYEC